MNPVLICVSSMELRNQKLGAFTCKCMRLPLLVLVCACLYLGLLPCGYNSHQHILNPRPPAASQKGRQGSVYGSSNLSASDGRNNGGKEEKQSQGSSFNHANSSGSGASGTPSRDRSLNLLGWQLNPVKVLDVEVPPHAYLALLACLLLFPAQQTLICAVVLFVLYRWHIQSRQTAAAAPYASNSAIRR